MARFMGREPAPAVVAAAQVKYRAIGGASPLPGIAASIARSLEHHLADRGHDVPVRAGMRYWEPSIPSAVEDLVGLGVTRIVMLSLSAFEFRLTCEAYRASAHEAAGAVEHLDVCEAPMLHKAPQYRDFFGHRLAHAIDHVGAARPLIIMTAHSLPLEEVSTDHAYVAGLREVADAVAAIAGLAPGADFSAGEGLGTMAGFGAFQGPVPWLLAYQSKGARPVEWLGPDLGDVMRAAASSGYDGVVVCPIGFVTDHVETLWDLDVEAARLAIELGLDFVRTAVPNDDDDFVEALVWAVEPLL
jgi:ferrochelatase